ncbi:NUDIX domain-containing protein [Actinokineospora inagensis]|uniref:NUDIX domain-containing protein n=1 Tax=Actinokineospora inagensis TaxID=103730 RepID=UPI000408CDAC|nr:NUDIX hydrolase [Actinokineospora inagensis]
MAEQAGAARAVVGLTVDLVVLGDSGGVPVVLAVERAKPPFRGHLALPGGFVEPDEGLARAAVRELAEETGVVVGCRQLRQVGIYGDPGRDPRGRIVSVAYRVRLDGVPAPVAGSDAKAARWVPVTVFLDAATPVAFDHREILHAALRCGSCGCPAH